MLDVDEAQDQEALAFDQEVIASYEEGIVQPYINTIQALERATLRQGGGAEPSTSSSVSTSRRPSARGLAV